MYARRMNRLQSDSNRFKLGCISRARSAPVPTPGLVGAQTVIGNSTSTVVLQNTPTETTFHVAGGSVINATGDGDRFGSSYDWTTDGVQIGIDHTAASAWTFGVSVGYADTNTQDARSGRNAVRSMIGGAHANYASERLGVSALAMYADHESHTTRNATIGTATRQAHATFDYDSMGAGLRLDYRLTSLDQPLVRPFAELFYDRIEGVAFAERDAAAGNLNARTHDRKGLRGTLGLQFADDCEGYGLVFHPSLEVGVVHQFLDTQSTLDIAFGGTSSFRTYGVQRNRTSFRANAALGISLGTKVSAIALAMAARCPG